MKTVLFRYLMAGVGGLRRPESALRNARNGSTSMVYVDCLVGPRDPVPVW